MKQVPATSSEPVAGSALAYDPNASYKVVCLTGGPCGGKTSSISILSDLFQSLGWTVYRVPETATILFGAGVHFPSLDENQSYSFQKSILRTMLTVEQTFRELAKINAQKGEKTVIICDRGAMDPSAYMERDLWLKMISELGYEEVQLRDHRYDIVIHLVSAAKGAEAFYSAETNQVRSEGISLARELDNKVMNAWLGHASLKVIDNESVANFAQKCDRVVEAVSIGLGLRAGGVAKPYIPSTIRKRKFLVHGFDLATSEFPLDYKEFRVEHIYLVNTKGNQTQTRIRRRQELGTNSVHLTMTMRHPEVSGQRVETRRNLNPREYEGLVAQADPERDPIVKTRRAFLYMDRYFQLDVFQSPAQLKGLCLLEAYIDDASSDASSPTGVAILPPWLETTEVTDQKEYSMYWLAYRKAKSTVISSGSA